MSAFDPFLPLESQWLSTEINRQKGRLSWDREGL